MMRAQSKAERLLRKLKSSESGKLTIFLGAAPGVGKTYAMLSAAKERLNQGISVTLGVVETHGRKETQAMIEGIQQLPLRQVEYQGTPLTEFDIDAALQQKPALIIVDELAHSNIPNSRNKFRYQDVGELLAAGIDVYTTVNIQHMASLNDVVRQVTGVRVTELVPDYIFDLAHEIILIDLPPDGLVQRLQEGKVYLPEYARSALEQFFSLENLIALREMAIREVLVRVDTNLSDELVLKDKTPSYTIQDKLVVLISANSQHDYLVRLGRQIADRRHMPWYVVWIDTGRPQSTSQRMQLRRDLELAEELGAKTMTLKGATSYDAAVKFLEEQRISNVLVGARRRWRFNVWSKPLYRKLIESNLNIEVSIYHPPQMSVSPRRTLRQTPILGQKPGYLVGTLLTVVATVLALAILPVVGAGNVALIYVAAIVTTGLKFGSRPALATALLAFLAFNFFLTEPFYTFAVDEQNDVATLVFLLFIGLISGPAASRLRRQFMLLNESSRFSDTLRDSAETLTKVTTEAQVFETFHRVCQNMIEVEAAVVIRDNSRAMKCVEGNLKLNDKLRAGIDWVFTNGNTAGRFSNTLSSLDEVLLPLGTQSRPNAVAVLKVPASVRQLSLFQQQLLESMQQQCGTALQRIQLASALENTKISMEVEQLRTALLSSVSHDLKSPLSSMMGSAELLRFRFQQISENDRIELIDGIISESKRLENYIQNLLDMTRLGYGELKLERDWVEMDDVISSTTKRLKRYYPDIELRVSVSGKHAPIYVHGALIEQGLFNILENAARFSPPDAPVCIEHLWTHEYLEIEIKDSGPGISDEVAEKVFDMFYVVADGDSKKNNTGMGLAICRGMIGAHGGEVFVDNKRITDQGTCFVIRLPLDQRNQPNTSQSNKAIS
ncbi:sensor histidine kinase KdpD [Aliidiomarina iranensis]|uniref:histidine kinase n=1 Tax=Aliidiomarina iranensis TaxID=1434071 RepID=A0A432W286_9GAMM|nr:sensor histidine kinase KdpD [Aliidiomarina iranensis]RUO23308.1 sensor histidine kinase KdpD [Aliidiomarina iranensis]